MCLSCEGANLWLHTALQMSARWKKLKIFVAQLNTVLHHELADLNSQHASIHSTSDILTKTHALPTTIILLITPLSSSPLYPTRVKTPDQLSAKNTRPRHSTSNRRLW